MGKKHKWGIFEDTKIPINADSFPCPRVGSNNRRIKNKEKQKEKPSNESESNGKYKILIIKTILRQWDHLIIIYS